MVKTQFDKTVKIIRSDNGPEFLLQSFYTEHGILHQRSCVYTPQQNARIERRHQHILNISRALMFQSNLPKVYWSYAVQHAVFLINRTPTKLLQDKSPHEMLYGVEPDLTMLRVFGCLCYSSTLPVQRHKFDPRASKGVFLGYKQGMKGYVILDLHSRSISISRNVVFYELEFPYKPSVTLPDTPSFSPIKPDFAIPIDDTPSNLDPTITDNNTSDSSPPESIPAIPALRQSTRPKST
ncbi:peptide transporter PTR2, partial [Trifolium medium]|nr:peptide transporter PTR2 [Trifolium medium]